MIGVCLYIGGVLWCCILRFAHGGVGGHGQRGRRPEVDKR